MPTQWGSTDSCCNCKNVRVTLNHLLSQMVAILPKTLLVHSQITFYTKSIRDVLMATMKCTHHKRWCHIDLISP